LTAVITESRYRVSTCACRAEAVHKRSKAYRQGASVRPAGASECVPRMAVTSGGLSCSHSIKVPLPQTHRPCPRRRQLVEARKAGGCAALNDLLGRPPRDRRCVKNLLESRGGQHRLSCCGTVFCFLGNNSVTMVVARAPSVCCSSPRQAAPRGRRCKVEWS